MALIATAICISAASQSAADDAPGVVRISDRQHTPVQQTSFTNSSFLHLGHRSASEGCATGCTVPESCCPAPVGCAAPEQCCPPPVQCAVPAPYCQPIAEGCCTNDGCDDCESYECCKCGCCGGGSRGLFSKMFCSGRSRCTCDSCEYCGKGGGKGGATLFDCLFGCMTPSGMCGQGAPLCGKYQITYADKPAYADPRDGQAWAAQGYGMPVTVPTAPVVRYSYNYSHGTPASRLTPLSTYNPATGPRSLFLQSWH
jgi:hypothetical protein